MLEERFLFLRPTAVFDGDSQWRWQSCQIGAKKRLEEWKHQTCSGYIMSWRKPCVWLLEALYREKKAADGIFVQGKGNVGLTSLTMESRTEYRLNLRRSSIDTIEWKSSPSYIAIQPRQSGYCPLSIGPYFINTLASGEHRSIDRPQKRSFEEHYSNYSPKSHYR